jgi:hypothetical protein
VVDFRLRPHCPLSQRGSDTHGTGQDCRRCGEKRLLALPAPAAVQTGLAADPLTANIAYSSRLLVVYETHFLRHYFRFCLVWLRIIGPRRFAVKCSPPTDHFAFCHKVYQNLTRGHKHGHSLSYILSTVLRFQKNSSLMSHNRSLAQVVSRRLPITAARLRAQIMSCGICDGMSGTEAGFLRVLRFPLPLIQSTNYSTFITIYHPGLLQ